MFTCRSVCHCTCSISAWFAAFCADRIACWPWLASDGVWVQRAAATMAGTRVPSNKNQFLTWMSTIARIPPGCRYSSWTLV